MLAFSKFLAFWLLLFTFALAVPTPSVDSSSDLTPLTNDTDSIARPANDHGPPYCNPTGPGVCNLAFWSRNYPNAAYKALTVYNRYCHEIGGTDYPIVHGITNLYSQLPYTLVVDFDHVSFAYAGGVYNRCIRYLDYSGAPFNAAQIYQCAFDCGNDGWQHRNAGGNSTDADPGGGGASESGVARRDGSFGL